METLIKTIIGENGELISTKNGRNIHFANVDLKLEIYETRLAVKSLSVNGVKRTHGVLAVTFNHETSQELTEELLEAITRFILVGDFQRPDGVYERMTFDDITLLDDIEIDNPEQEWEFEVKLPYPDMQKLLTF